MVRLRLCVSSATRSTSKSTTRLSSSLIRRGSSVQVDEPPSQGFHPTKSSGAAYELYGLYSGHSQRKPSCLPALDSRDSRHWVCVAPSAHCSFHVLLIATAFVPTTGSLCQGTQDTVSSNAPLPPVPLPPVPPLTAEVGALEHATDAAVAVTSKRTISVVAHLDDFPQQAPCHSRGS